MNLWDAVNASPWAASVVVAILGWSAARFVVAVGQAIDLVRRGRAKP